MNQIAIEDFIPCDKDSAITAAALAQILNTTKRVVMRHIQDRRRAGVAILASRGERPGFFLASDPDQVRQYARALEHEERELKKTREAVEAHIRRW